MLNISQIKFNRFNILEKILNSDAGSTKQRKAYNSSNNFEFKLRA